jgi:NAD(P)-dependent dehydrogenase (short-subunit alcohol dehydrogenase family)
MIVLIESNHHLSNYHMGNYLVVGASSGIGQAITNQLSTEGHHVFATYQKNQFASSSNITTFHINVLDDQLDFTALPSTLDGLVYCPGAINLRPFARIAPNDFTQDFNLQVGGAIKVIQAALPSLKSSGNASIILFSTVAVQLGLNFHSQVSVSKGAIEGLTKALSAELAPSIRVNCIAPSLTDTPLAASLLNTEQKVEANALRHPLKRIGKVTDIAEMACFLLAEKSSWITGQIIHVDGGMSTIKI